MIYFLYSIILISSIFFESSDNYHGLTNSFIISSIIAYLSLKYTIPLFKKFKLEQIIRSDGPNSHKNKKGTPTMGGIIVVPISVFIGILININSPDLNRILSISILGIAFMFIGLIDDWKILINKNSVGLTPKNKLIIQILVSSLFIFWSYHNNWINSDISFFSFNDLKTGWLIWPISLFVLVAESNSTNLTDGLDGLAAGCGSLIFAGLGIHICRDINSDIALANLCFAMSGSWIGFLKHNIKPAKIFMGDTGSLSMGATLGGIALISDNLLPLLIMGGVFLAESVSVIIQVGTYKLSKKLYGYGKRVFKMAPIHHHFEMLGTNEAVIVKNFWLVTVFLICTALFFTLIT